MGNQSRQTLSVVLPVYNGAAYLTQALDSISRQKNADLTALQIIAVDDGSTDESPGILRQWSSRLPLEIIRREGGSNWMAATNEGLGACTGDWISFLHQDDCWMPDRLHRLHQAFEQWPDVSFFCHPTRFLAPDGRPIGTWSPPFRTNVPLNVARDILPRYATQNNIAIPAPCFQRRLLETGLRLPEDQWFLADWAFWLQLLHASEQAVVLPGPLAGFRIHPESQTSRRSDDETDLRRQFAGIRNLVTRLNQGKHPRLRASEVNENLTLTLANWSHNQSGHFFKTLLGYLLLGPVSWLRFPRETRILQRLLPRLKLRRKPAERGLGL